jgi:hypothetical protein
MNVYSILYYRLQMYNSMSILMIVVSELCYRLGNITTDEVHQRISVMCVSFLRVTTTSFP